MTEIEQLLERQARWQASRAKLSWAEKLRLAETLREAAMALGRGRRKQPQPHPPPAPDSETRQEP